MIQRVKPSKAKFQELRAKSLSIKHPQETYEEPNASGFNQKKFKHERVLVVPSLDPKMPLKQSEILNRECMSYGLAT